MKIFLRRRLPILLALSLFLGSGVVAAAQVLPSEEPPASPPANARSEAVPHGAAPSASGPVEPGLVRFDQAVRATVAAGSVEGLRFHEQGDLGRGGEGVGIEDGETGFGAPVDEPPSPPPTIDDGPGSAAPGDIVRSFEGVADSGWVPPDPVLAVGPSHVLEAVNSGFAVYTKTGGTSQGYTTYTSFLSGFLPAGWQGFLFDPRAVYWPENGGRYVQLVLGLDTTNQDSYVFLLVSQTTDPTGSWWVYRFDASIGGDTDAWADFCGLGADRWGLYFTCNMFRYTGSFKHAKLWAIDTGPYGGSTANGSYFADLRWVDGTFADSLQPAQAYSAAFDEATFFVNSRFSSGNQLSLWKLTGSRGSSPSLVRSTLSSQSYDMIGENVDQPGSSFDLDGGDTRVASAVYARRKVYVAQTTDVANDGTASGWLTNRLDVDGNVSDWSHLLWGGPGFYYFFPALTLDAPDATDPNLAIFGSWTDTETTVTAATQYASSLFKVYENQPNSSDGPFVSFASGSSSYVALASGRNRWGDYSGAAYDWSTGDAWGVAELAGTSNSWRTRIVSVELVAAAGCSADAYEPDNSTGTASAIASGSSQSHNICPAGDDDWVTFTLGQESAVVLETSGPSGDTLLSLWDAGGLLIESDDDSGTGLFSFIDRTCASDPLPAGTYFVRAEEFGDNDEIASYQLSYDLVESCGSCAQTLQLSNQTLSGTVSYQASSQIILGPDLIVQGPSIQVTAGQRVVMRDGTRISGSFVAGIDPQVCSSAPTPGGGGD